MKEFKEGQRVNVEYTGKLKFTAPDETVAVEDGSGHWHYYVPGSARITLAEPKDWPPQVGDIWEAGGEEYYVSTWKDEGAIVHPFHVTDQNYSYIDNRAHARDLCAFKALNPVLVRRRGQ